MKAVDNVLKEAILNGLYDKDKNNGNEFLSPQLVSNDQENKIWFTLRQELLSATSFTWAVAFISENISITSVPIYYLNVNTKIEIVDNERGINGDYLVNKLTVPLTYNGTMSITATKVVNTIY